MENLYCQQFSKYSPQSGVISLYYLHTVSHTITRVEQVLNLASISAMEIKIYKAGAVERSSYFLGNFGGIA